ncbi:DUF3307 domain-containing protein [Candidatus Peregrinibacteria bacterium]|nr:DUF3307 domain-containing protein [Candidatus Peregrinibacteria bacterium]
MNLVFHFLLAHFIADYPLQNGWLIKSKRRSFWGVLLHTFIHLAVVSAALLPFWGYQEVRWAIGVIFVTHTAIDQLKIFADSRLPKCRLLCYGADQLLHWAIIGALSLYIGVRVPVLPFEWMAFYADKSVVAYVLALVVSTYFWDITRWFWRTRKEPVPYRRDYKMMAWNVFIVSIAFAVYWMAY